ncbi:MAG TPA: DUF2189 domain-containing protein [Dongiaceae bacterium]|nr:DUF2189 domain-containing protein [Dongiaceae bacterium]
MAQIDSNMPSSNGAEMGEQQAVETVLARPVRVVDVERPWLWLRAGWRDFLAAKSISLTFGLMISAASLILISLLWQVDLLPYVLPLAAGFMFLAPAFAICFYEISRRLERKEPVRLEQVATAWRPHVSQIAFMGLVMVLFQMVWIRIATLIFALFFGSQPASWDRFITVLFFSTDGIPFLVVGTLVGGILAVLSFAISVTAFPMLLDRDVGAAAAIATSVHAAARNWRVMIGWAALIVLFTAAGLVTLCLGLAVTMPLIGHASWHAYRDLVADGD